MLTLKKYNLNGDEVGEVALEDSFLSVEANLQMIKDYIVALRANARQWSANTKDRSEVNHTTKKPYRQKGTGNARQGSLASPQFKGGGVVFGPKPKFNQHSRVNSKERRLSVWYLLAEKAKEGKLHIVEDAAFSDALQVPKTKTVASFLKRRELSNKSLLFVGEGFFKEVGTKKVSAASLKHQVFKKSVRNLPKSAFVLAANVNGYDLLAARAIVMTESGLKELQTLLMR